MTGLPVFTTNDPASLKAALRARARAMGFDQLAVAALDLTADEQHLLNWLAAGHHGDMSYLARHAAKRGDPARFKPGTVRAICVRMDYWPGEARPAQQVLEDGRLGYVSRYALGRDYHKLMRNRLQDLATELEAHIGRFGYRVCVDSAPVLEKALARNAGLGWIGKHTNLLTRDAGSLFFLGEILTDLPLPADDAVSEHCGSCTACIEVCPTQAIIGPYRLDARRCISYLTIEHQSAIPVELRPALGNRIYGCDDCQLVCPWNRYAHQASHPDFRVRNGLDAASLVELFGWTEQEFEQRMRGSAIYRLGFERWSRNIAVALGNAPTAAEVVSALQSRRQAASPLVREHIDWALARHASA